MFAFVGLSMGQADGAVLVPLYLAIFAHQLDTKTTLLKRKRWASPRQCPTSPDRLCGMTLTSRKRITLEPELEVMAGSLSPAERRKLAASFRAQALVWSRWARQLEVSARALSVSPPRKSRLAFVSATRVRLN